MFRSYGCCHLFLHSAYIRTAHEIRDVLHILIPRFYVKLRNAFSCIYNIHIYSCRNVYTLSLYVTFNSAFKQSQKEKKEICRILCSIESQFLFFSCQLKQIRKNTVKLIFSQLKHNTLWMISNAKWNITDFHTPYQFFLRNEFAHIHGHEGKKTTLLWRSQNKISDFPCAFSAFTKLIVSDFSV